MSKQGSKQESEQDIFSSNFPTHL